MLYMRTTKNIQLAKNIDGEIFIKKLGFYVMLF